MRWLVFWLGGWENPVFGFEGWINLIEGCLF